MKLVFSTILASIALCGTINAFELSPRIYPEGTVATLRFKASSSWAKKWIKEVTELKAQGKDKVARPGKEMPLLGYMREDRRHSTSEKFQDYGYPEQLDFEIKGDEVITTVKLNGLENHNFRFGFLGQTNKRNRQHRVIKVLTLDKETFKLRPFKGNVHQHSIVSVHAKHTPEEHIGYSRIAGFDFIGVSDHNRFEQNKPAIKAATESKSGLSVYNAEELHSPAAVLHGLSIGGTKLHSHRKPRKEDWNKQVQPILDGLKKELPNADEFDLRLIAEALLLVRRAKADGAFVAFCHPAYTIGDMFRNNNLIMSDYLIRSGEFHAVEIVNSTLWGKGARGNSETMAQIYEISTKLGRPIQVISSSDCHDVARANFRNCYNIIFAPDSTFPSFKSAVIDFRSVATFELENGKKPGVYSPLYFGPLKYVRYANFLDHIGYWPKHDRLAKRQGELILKYVRGDKSVLPQIAQLARRINRLRESLYYKPAAK